MARIPMGKVLLRNVIRHTDAHNKIQEESEMWKIREKEKQAGKMRFFQQRRESEGLSGNRMRCDGYDEEDEEQKATAAAAQKMFTAQDERESRIWTKKLYDFEARDPNRWGHSGYKELYPEEFESESDQKDSDGHAANGEKPMHPETLKLASHKRKRSSKTSKKKHKKKSRKKVRRKRSLQSSDSSSDGESSVEEENGRKRIKAKKRREKAAGQQKEQPGRPSDSGSSNGRLSDTSSKDGSSSSARLQKDKKRRKKKERRNIPMAEGDREIRSKKRKNWKIAPNDSSDESGDEELN